MGHEKAARLLFCTCPCDILSGVSMLRTAFKQSCCHHFQHLLWWYILSAYGCSINFCIYAMLRARATFSWPILY